MFPGKPLIISFVSRMSEIIPPRIPLYSTLKAIFLLYLVLPQTQGATYIYHVHLRPFFATHEKQIDKTLAEVRVRVYRFVQEKARALWTALIGALAPGAEGVAAQQGSAGTGLTQPPPTMNNPAAGPTQLISSLWTSYGPGIIAGSAAFLRQTAAATLPAGTPGPATAGVGGGQPTLNTPPGSTFFHQPSGVLDPVERRKQLEAELAALSSIPIPPANNPARPISLSHSSSSSSSSGVRERANSGKFEEIKGGDVEGFEVDEDFDGRHVPGTEPPKAGWFGGWGSGSSAKGSYERVKTD